MTIDEMRQHEWVVSWSGGKDSTATIILMHENKIPIKKIVYVRMMYDDELPATLPIMTDFVDRAAEVFREWGYEVMIVPSVVTAKGEFSRVYQRSKYPDRNGKMYGMSAFMKGGCVLSGHAKVATIRKTTDSEDFHMVGYAADETDRLHRLTEKNQSIMVTLGVKEVETFNICSKYALLSPLYGLGLKRDGCWFCPNASKKEREMIKREYPELYQKIVDMIEMVDFDFGKQKQLNNWVIDYFNNKDQISFVFKETEE